MFQGIRARPPAPRRHGETDRSQERVETAAALRYNDGTMPRLFARTVLLALLLSCCAPPDASGADLAFTYRARALHPGEVVLINARSAHPLDSLQVEAFGRAFPAFREQDELRWTALVGIALDTEPGRYLVELKGVGRNDRSLAARTTLTVAAKNFPVRRLTVAEKFVTPPDEALDRIAEERAKVNAIFASLSPRRLWSGPFTAPVPGEVISVFGKRNIYNGQPRQPHSGIDFRGAAGTPVQAPNAGRVALADDLYFSGNTVILDHGLGLYSYLCHLSEFSVKAGDRVEAGDRLGRVGATGRVTGPHLHWTVRLARTLVDPLSLIHILERAP